MTRSYATGLVRKPGRRIASSGRRPGVVDATESVGRGSSHAEHRVRPARRCSTARARAGTRYPGSTATEPIERFGLGTDPLALELVRGIAFTRPWRQARERVSVSEAGTVDQAPWRQAAVLSATYMTVWTASIATAEGRRVGADARELHRLAAADALLPGGSSMNGARLLFDQLARASSSTSSPPTASASRRASSNGNSAARKVSQAISAKSVYGSSVTGRPTSRWRCSRTTSSRAASSASSGRRRRERPVSGSASDE